MTYFFRILAASLFIAVTCQAIEAELPAWKADFQPEDDAWKQTKQEFTYNSGAEPETLDPHIVTAVDSSRLADALFEGLLTPDPKTLEPRPGCAESWTVSDDGKVYTFKLRNGLQWSNGVPLTSTDFVQSWKRALTPATGASYVQLYFFIVGAEDFHKGKTGDFKTVGVQAVDDLTLKVNLSAPCGYFLELLTLSVFSPVPVEVAAKHGNKWLSPENIVCNGPFLLNDWKHRDKLILIKNPNYWDSGFVKLDKITALCVDDMNTAYKLFQDGQADWLPDIPKARIEELRRSPDYYVYPYFGTYFYRFNVTKAPFNDARVRRAFSLATYRPEITDKLLKSGETPAASYCPSVAGYIPAKGLPYNVATARRLLAEAGYPEGKGFPLVDLSYNTSEDHKLVAEAVAQQWKRSLGINVVSRNSEWKVFLNDMKELKYMIARSSWIGDYSDPSTFYDCFQSDSGNNRTGWKNKTYDDLLAQAGRELDKDRRFALFAKAEKLLVEEESVILPVYRYVASGMLSERVLGWESNIRNTHPLKYIWLED